MTNYSACFGFLQQSSKSKPMMLFTTLTHDRTTGLVQILVCLAKSLLTRSCSTLKGTQCLPLRFSILEIVHWQNPQSPAAICFLIPVRFLFRLGKSVSACKRRLETRHQSFLLHTSYNFPYNGGYVAEATAQANGHALVIPWSSQSPLTHPRTDSSCLWNSYTLFRAWYSFNRALLLRHI